MRLTLTVVCSLALVTSAFVARAQQAPASAPPVPAPAGAGAPVTAGDVAAQLASINASLAAIADLLRRQADQNDLGILMKRVELQNFLLMESNRNLQAQRDLRDSYQSQLDSIGDEMREWDDEPAVDERTAQGEDLERLRMRRKWRERMEREQAKLTDNVKRINAQIQEIENQVATTRDDITRWQAMVDDWFERPPAATTR